MATASALEPRNVRLRLALAVGLVLPLLPSFLQLEGLGGSTDLSAQLGLSGGIGVGTFAVLYLAGVLTSLTPCVYPLIPITVSVFGARKAESRAKAAALSLTYVLGIAATYSLLGLFAALSGKAFGSALSSPLIALAMVFFMFALAASMFGAFELDLPSSLKGKLTSVRGVGFVPAFAMGLAAGIIAAPCTGPVLAGVLTFVATQRSVALGFWMLFTYAIGMGTLFFVIGATTIKLPRSGVWMETVKSVLGVALVAAGVALLLPMLPKPSMLPLGKLPLSVIAGVVAFAAVFAGALSLSFHGERRERWLKGVSLVGLTLAIGLQFGWFGGPRVDAHKLQQQIQWLHSEAEALAQAKATGKKVLVDFYADWCAACKELDVHTFSDPAVQAEVADKFIPLKVDATDTTDEVERLTAKYGVPGLPTVLMMACNEEKPKPSAQCTVPQEGPGRLTGFEPPGKLLERMRRLE